MFSMNRMSFSIILESIIKSDPPVAMLTYFQSTIHTHKKRHNNTGSFIFQNSNNYTPEMFALHQALKIVKLYNYEVILK